MIIDLLNIKMLIATARDSVSKDYVKLAKTKKNIKMQVANYLSSKLHSSTIGGRELNEEEQK